MSVLFPQEPVRIPIRTAPAEVLSELKRAAVLESLADYFGEHLTGRIGPGEIVLRCSSPLLKNSGAIQFRGSISDDGQYLEGYLETSRRVRWAMVIALGIFAAVGLRAITEGTRSLGGAEETVGATFALVIGLLGALLIPRLVFVLGYKDREVLLATLDRASRGPAA
jgi:hypothetical protein